MHRGSTSSTSTRDRRGIPVAGLGILVAVLSLFIIPSPGGPANLAMAVLEGVSVSIGLWVVTAGAYSYWTGNLRPAIVATTFVGTLLPTAVLGGLLESRTTHYVPLWGWVLAIATATVISLAMRIRVSETERQLDGQRR